MSKDYFKEIQEITRTHAELTRREKQLQDACEKAKTTGNAEDLKRYLKMRSQ